MEDAEQVRLAQCGDRDALEQLLGAWYPAVFAYFYKNTGRYHLSKDLTQEVLIKAVAGIRRYRPRASFRSWLFAIASNHLKNHYRTLARHPEGGALPEDLPGGETALSDSERKSDIGAALARLPPAQREALILRFYHDLSLREIAAATGARETTVKARIRYGLEKLKLELEGYDVSDR